MYWQVFINKVKIAGFNASCSLPDGETVCVGFYFDLEMQRESEPEYPVVKRVFITVADWSADKLNGWGKNHITR